MSQPFRSRIRESLSRFRKVPKRKLSPSRICRFEQLEARRVLAAAIWHNAMQPFDVDGTDRIVSPLDVLVLINEINNPRYSDSSGRLPRQVEVPQRGPFFDVDCDGAVTPLDVLNVINYLNNPIGPGGEYSSSGSGLYASAACSPLLIEESAFATEFSHILVLPDDSSAVRVHFETPTFDTTSNRTIRDAFEIEVTDLAGNVIALPFAPDYRAVFNWTEGQQKIYADGVSLLGPNLPGEVAVTINLGGVPAGSQVRVTARLVNNDLDDTSSVLLRGFEVIGSPTVAPTAFRSSSSRPLAQPPVDFSKLTDLTGSLIPSYGRTTLFDQNTRLASEFVATNASGYTVQGDLIVVIENISTLDANVLHPDGFTPDGKPYWNLSGEMNSQPLGPGMSIRSREIRFLNTSDSRFQYELKTYGRINRAPAGFESLPNTSIEAGKRYLYSAIASDPDLDLLAFSLVSSPENMSVNPVTGQVRWDTELDDVGSHRVILRATDPHGLFVEQMFSIDVVESLQNRPPIFISDPVTEAIASSGFEITTVAVGPMPNGVSVISGFRSPRLVSINAGDQTVSVHAGQNNDRFDDTTVYSTGEPRPTGAAIDVGYSVDIGLPPFLVPNDTNDVLGMDQGDLNGNGILDLVVMTKRTESTKPQGQRDTIEITRMLGDGDGNFSPPLVIATIPIVPNTQAKHLRVADIDGDGRLDVIAIEETSSRLITVRGLGNGEFESAVLTTLATSLNDYRLVDLDGDGQLDIVGRNANVTDLGWMRGVGDGSFEPFVRLADGGDITVGASNYSTRSYDFADLNGDGHLDIVLGEYNSGNVVVLLNDGEQNFSIALTIDPPGGFQGPLVVHIADFTGDGELDIFTINHWQSRVDLFVGDGTGTGFTHQPGADLYGLAGNAAGSDGPVDINGDGHLDIVLTNTGTNDPTSPQVLINDGQGNFTRNDYPMLSFPGHSTEHNRTSNDIARGAMFGDYNGDGVMDLIYMTAGNDFNGVGIRLGTRPGEFGATRTIAGQDTFDSDVHAADFNGDGIVDLLLLRSASMMLGNGDGTFAEPFPAVQVARPSTFGAVADFNLDGVPDYVAVRNANQSPAARFYVALANGDGTFDISDDQPATGSFYGYQDIRIEDFNNDGYPDIIAKAGVERFIDVYLNDPDDPGTFTQSFRTVVQAQGVDANGFTNAFATGDFDGDGNIDFVAVDQLPGEPQKLVLFSGDGAGNFSATKETFAFDDAMFQVGFYYPGVLQSGDLNGDGVLDIVSFGWHGAIVHMGNGDGTFTSIDHYPREVFNQRAKNGYLIDFDEDGHLDLIQYSHQETLNIRRGFGDGTFGEPERVGMIGRGSPISFADLDHDGHLDMAMMMTGAGNYNNGDTVLFFGARDGLVDHVAADLNGDGNEEILAINEANDRLKIFLGDNLGRLTRQADLFTGRAPKAVTVGDLNGDGQLEIITANRAGRSISVFTGSIATGYSSIEIPVGNGPIDVKTADVNGDGHLDVLVLDDSTNALWILTGSADGTLADPIAIALGDKPGRFTIADATGDGELNAVITLPDSNRVMILSGLNFRPDAPAPIYIHFNSSPSDVVVTDLNFDGKPDLAVTLPNENVLSVHYGLGGGQFARPQRIAVGEQPTRVTLADADEDGRMDLIVANSGDGTASVIYNRFDPNEVYRYNSKAIDPDDDPIVYSIVDGPGGLIINSETGALLWAASPDQVGVHDVTIQADDGRGGIATQSFKIDVQPARDNASPLFATEPSTTIGANETFTYQATALDNDRDTLRYRLLDGPTGAAIDPTTGEVTWDARTDLAIIFAPHGNTSTGRIEVAPSPSLQPASLTVEAWYNFHTLPASNQRTYLMTQAGTHGRAYALYNFGNSSLRFEMDFGAPVHNFTYTIPFVPTSNRWYHIALTIDDATRTATVFVDGAALGSTAIPNAIQYNPASRTQIGDSSAFYTRAIVDNYRIWNVARTPEEIAEGLSRQYENDSRIVLDYRFDLPDTLTVRDYSPAGNHGYRIANGMLPPLVPGLAAPGSYEFSIGVEDGRGGFDTQTFTVDILPELRGSIRGQLFDDLDGDGARQTGEPVLAGWHLFIDSNGNGFADPHELQTTTDAQGNYRFDGLLPGEYPLRVSPVAGYESQPVNHVSVTANGVNVADIAIEQLSLSHIRGQLRTEDDTAIAHWRVFADLDGNGVLDDNEPSTISDRDGFFALTGLSAGTYNIRPSLPAGWSDIAGRDGLTVALAADEIASDNDFVLRPTNTSVTGGLHFVTAPNTSLEARETFRYTSVAMGLFNEAIVYDLSLAPEGMTIDPVTGLVAWRPTIAQVGEHLVILRATSASRSLALQDFYIDVAAPNTSPALAGIELHQPQGASPRFPSAYVDLVYAVDLVAQDAEEHEVTFTLLNGPTGATLHSATGQLRWTPALSDLGQVAFSVELRDELGASSIFDFSVEVVDAQPVSTPFAITLPRNQVGIGQDYFAQIRGTDALDRPLSWSLTSGPDGMSVSPSGTLQWTPGNADFGNQAVELQATDVDGASEVVQFTLQVVGRPVNAAPQIISTPIISTVLGYEYQYDVIASDADSDPLSFALVEAPAGMSIHPSLGTIRWTPSNDQLVEATVTIQVIDPDGRTDSQSFKLKVSRFGGPPKITSIPPTHASVGTGYLYSIAARDAEGDPLTYRLLAAPNGMTIVETTGVISWTPSLAQVGQQDVVIEVSDGIGGAATQAFAIRVGEGIPNLPPVIHSTAPRFGSVGAAYQYQLDATDPEGTNLSYSLGQAPAGLTINASTGLVSWNPSAGQVGQFIVTLIATDAGGASAVESFQVDVLAENNAPTIVSNAPPEVMLGVVFTYQVIANDIDRDPLTYTLTSAPAGASIDNFGKITWPTTGVPLGDYDFSVLVQDPRGGQSTQSFQIAVLPDTEAPKVSLIERPNDGSRNVLPWQGPFVVYVRAIDNVGIASLTLSANGRDIPLDAAGTATFTFEDWTFQRINATATAIDTSGNVTTRTISFDYDFPEGWSGAGTADIPTAIISSPSDTQTVFGMVSIEGTAAHENFAAYKLSYRRIDETSYTEFLQSDTPVTNGQLGVWDTSLLINDEYVIRLEVATSGGIVNVVEHNVGLAGELKLGNFRLSFTDMIIPVAGIPIEITRIYDTLQADRQGDFGYGWRLEYRNTDLRVGLPKSGLEDIGIFPALRAGVKVFLNIPGEGRVGFTFNPDIRVLPGFGGNNLVLARPRFTPDPGVTATLSTGTSSYLQVNEYGELYAPGGIPYNPASPSFGGAYVLTTRKGITYRVDGATGKLTSASDGNGNRVDFEESRISGSNGIQLDIVRDRQGRISSISTSDSIRLEYRYKDGNLVEFIDGERNATSFVYSPTRPHHLHSVIDPLERAGLRLDYDDHGRLVQTILANGAIITTSYDPDNSIRSVIDPMGNSSIEEYDPFGNIVKTTNALSGIVTRTYDSSGNETSITDELGRTTSTVYNQRGDVIKITDPAGNSIFRTYSSFGDIQAETDRMGHTTTNAFDERGNLIRQTNPLGISSDVVYDSKGNIVLLDSVTGQQFEIKQLAGISDAIRIFGVGTTEVVYGALGLPSQINLTEHGHTESVVVVAVDRDANSRQIRREYADGGVELFEYDANGNLIRRTNPNGNSIRFAYDELDRLVETIFPDFTTELRTYNPLGLVLSVTDRGGRVTEFEYDTLGRLITTTHPSDDVGRSNGQERREYDIAGQLTAVIDPLGNRRQFIYDVLGNNIEEIDALGYSVKQEFNAMGDLTRRIDQLGNAIMYDHDYAGRIIQVMYEDGSILKNEYDPFGNLIRSESANGAVTLFKYDAQNGLTKVTDALGQTTRYERNARGLITKTLDALGRETTLEYDFAGKLVSRTLPDGSSDRLEYDPAGNLIERISYSGKRTTFSYDSMERIVRMTFDDETVREFEYSPTGKPVLIRENESVVQYLYDSLDRLIEKTDSDGQTISYVYDLNGNLQSIDSIGGLVEYTYNARNELVAVASEQGISSYSYDAAGHQILSAMPNGVIESRSYDARSRMISQHFENGQGSLGVIRTEFDSVGRITGRFDTVRGISESFDYDLNNQLIRHITESVAGKTDDLFSYDAVGNRLTQLDSSKGQTTYTYDNRDRLVREDSSEQVVLHSYDLDGNLIAKEFDSDIRMELQWDAANRLVQTNTVKNATSQIVEYRYSPDGERYSDTQAGITNRWIVDTRRSNSAVLAKISSDSNITEFVRPAEGLSTIAIVTNGAAKFVGEGTNHTVLFASDSNGELADQYAYSAFGEPTVSVSGNLTPIQFNGEFRDSNGLDYLRSRYYDSSTGRFVSMDVFSGFEDVPGTQNRYSFAQNDPISGSDPSGFFTLTENQIVVGIIAGMTGAGAIYGGVRAIQTGQDIWTSMAFYAFAGFALGVAAVVAGPPAAASAATTVVVPQTFVTAAGHVLTYAVSRQVVLSTISIDALAAMAANALAFSSIAVTIDGLLYGVASFGRSIHDSSGAKA
ncbi:FG-GAP-like repeat-containing protein [Pirellulaceae bacterium SH449]